MTENDLELMMAWRSNPKVYKDFYAQDEPLDWENHVDWWRSRKNRRDWIITINTKTKWRDVGNVNISGLDSEIPEVGVLIGEVTAWGQGIATKAVEFAVDWIRQHKFPKARARIMDHNEKSKRVFEKAGFKRFGAARKNESEYQIEL